MRRSALPLTAAAVAAALIGLLIYGIAARGDHDPFAKVGGGHTVKAPDRSLPVLGAPAGTRRSLAAFRGRVVVLNFWASWCVPCRTETPLLESFQRSYGARGATVVGVNFRDTEPDARAFVRRYGLTYPSLRDIDGALADAYATRALPETFVIDRRGRVSAYHRGQIEGTWLVRAVAPLL